ncbi:MAG: hypothetical protein KA777_13250 [Rhodoferax sp.]|nr:hypothetical protein [Rhodoferax sp.]
MGRHHLVRLLGIVMLLGAILPAVVMMANGRWLLAAAAWAIVVAGLYLAVIGDRGIDRSNVEAVQKLKDVALNFNDSSICLDLRWIRALFFIPLFSVLGTLGLMVSFSLFSQEKYVGTFVSLCVAVIIIFSGVSFLVTAVIAYRDGLLVRMDALGIALWGQSPISWKLIEGVDLKEVEVKGRKQYQLILAVKPAYFLSGQSPSKLSWLHWTAPRFTPSSRTLVVPCALLNADPHLITQAAKVIADRFGSNRIKDWMHAVPIDEAVALQEAQAELESSDREVQRLITRLNVLNERTDADPQEVMDITRKLELSLQQTTALGNARLDMFKSRTERMNVQFVKIKWAIGVVFALGTGAIVLKIVSALGR